MAEEAGGTLGEMKASEDFDAVDNATVYTFQMEREVPES